MHHSYKKTFATIIHQYIESMNIEEIMSLIETPPANIPGDLAFPCFSLSKKLKKAPVAIAQELTAEVQSNIEQEAMFTKVQAVGPYLNIHIDTQHLAARTIKSILKQSHNYGKGEPTWQKILVEWWSPNTHKMLHVGHLRNTLVSEAMCSLYEFAWYDVIRSAYGWDIGAHVAKWIRYYQQFNNETMPTNPEEFCIWSGEIYSKATAKVKEDPETYKTQIHETQKLLENGDHTLNKIWDETRELSIQWLKNVFEELWSTIHKFYRESDVEQPGIELVKKYVEDTTIPHIKHSQGAIIADLEEYDLGVFVLLKSNGTSLYSTKDIALAYLKEEDYDFDLSLYVVATEQNHHFKQLFKTLELVWYDTSKLIHMGYELVELPSGKMSSRDGTIIPYHTWRDDAIQQAQILLEWREIAEKEVVARKVAFAALKFSMLLQDTYKKIRLDMDKSLSFEWETGPYLQYTYARIASLLRKQWSSEDTYIDGLETQAEHDLLITLSQFGHTIQQAVNDRKPSIIARYTLELCRQFNSYYSTTTIISDDKKNTAARIQLVRATQQVLHNGLALLWIDTLEKM